MPRKSNSVPTLAQAAAEIVRRALQESADKLLRVELYPFERLDPFFDDLDPNAQMRFGLTVPAIGSKYKRQSGVSENPRTITKWRNESLAKRKKKPVIIVGSAAGPAEAGLRAAPKIVRQQDLLDEFGEQLTGHIKQVTEALPPLRLCRTLIGMCKEGLIDPLELEKYFATSFDTEKAIVDESPTNLWQLGLIPDARAMDNPSGRLNANIREVGFLQSFPESAADVRRLERLSSQAKGGDPMAMACEKFRESQDQKWLKDVTLDGLLKILDSKPGTDGGGDEPDRTDKKQKEISLFDALDDPTNAEKVLAALEDSLTVAGDEIDAQAHLDGKIVHLHEQDDDDSKREWFAASVKKLGDDTVARIRFENGVSESQLISVSRVLETAELTDRQIGGRLHTDTLKELFAARKTLRPLCRFSENCYELLLTSESLRTAASQYLTLWRTIAGLCCEDDEFVAIRSSLAEMLVYLDGDWLGSETSGEFSPASVVLLPTHPFVLSPLLQLVSYVRNGQGTEQLGTQLQWALDKAIPAYPAFWNGKSTLLYQEGRYFPVFSARAAGVRPSVSGASGLAAVLTSFVGLHPYAKRCLNVVLVDPPPGSGVAAAINKILSGGGVERARVYHLTTGATGANLDSLEDGVESLGSTKDLAAWVTNCGVKAHVAIVFQQGRPATSGTHTGNFAPMHGVQNVLTVHANPPKLLTAGSLASTDLVPQVSVQPGGANEVVQLMMTLARAAKREDKFYEVQPLLRSDEASSLAAMRELAEWLVVGTPGPMGLLPPKHLAEGGLTYLGRESFGSYGLFVYGRDTYAVRKRIQKDLKEAPIAANVERIEEQIGRLALTVPNGVLRMGRVGETVQEHIGLIAATAVASRAINEL